MKSEHKIMGFPCTIQSSVVMYGHCLIGTITVLDKNETPKDPNIITLLHFYFVTL